MESATQGHGPRCRGLAILETEVSIMTMALKRSNVWSRSDAVSAHPTLLKPFIGLRAELSNSIDALDDLDPSAFLAPFLDVIRSDVVTGHVTGLALDAVHKLLSYELLHDDMKEIASAVENIADAVTHARFVGADPRSDEVVLMKILAVLRTLMLSQVGLLLTNEGVCEILQSTFRICFETRLSDLLRKTAELALNDMIQLLFTRLPTFNEESLPLLKRLKMRNTGQNEGKTKRKRAKDGSESRRQRQQKSPKPKKDVSPSPSTEKKPPEETTAPLQPPVANSPTINESFNVDSDVLARSPIGSVTDLTQIQSDTECDSGSKDVVENTASTPTEVTVTVTSPKGTEYNEEFVNSQGVTFTPTAEMVDDAGSLIPYGLPCVRELFRFLVSLINPHDGIGITNATSTTVGGITFQNDSMIQVALSLLATALETGAEYLDKYESLLDLVKDELTRNLVLLLASERVATFSSTLWISYLVFATQRRHLKYQMEIFLTRLIELVNNENNQKITYEHKELVLDMIVRLYKMPGFITQLYVNYDCDLYTHNIFEDLTKMLSKNAFPVTGLYSTQFLSLDALLTVVEAIERQCNAEKEATDDEEEVKESSMHEKLMTLKRRKKIIETATEQFNNKPSKAIGYMQETGLVQKDPLDPVEVAQFMRTNPHLDKKQLGEFISKRDNLHILKAFVESFDFANLRIDESLRIFLETFRLPGEAPLIQIILEHFSEHWQRSNGDQFANVDAAYLLSYAVIMLNVDQHNKNHTKTNEPMTAEQFKRNLRGTNGDKDHDQDMLEEIYHAIRTDEIVMPAEQTGLVKENYLWKCALKRGLQDKELETPKVMFDRDLFAIVWGPAVAALSYVFDKSRINEGGQAMIERALHGFQRCAAIAAQYRMSDVLDNIIISLCKFSTLTKASQIPYVFIPVYGANAKAMMATRSVFALAHKHGDILHDGWKNILDCVLWLFKCQMLPKTLMEAEDYVDPTGRVQLLREEDSPAIKVESGFLNSLVSFMSMSTGEANGPQRPRTLEEEEAASEAIKCVKDCHIEALITDSKFLQTTSLQQLVKHIIQGSNVDQLKCSPAMVNSETSSGTTSPATFDSSHETDEIKDESLAIFFLELLVRIAIQNKDRVTEIWPAIVEHMRKLIVEVAIEWVQKSPFLLERSVNALLRLAVRLARKEELASLVVQSLSMLEVLSHQSMYFVARHMAFGLYELLRNNAANIHETEDWAVIFNLVEMIGAGVLRTASDKSDEDSGHESCSSTRERSGSIGSSSGGWIVLDKADSNASNNAQQLSEKQQGTSIPYDSSAIMLTDKQIVLHDSLAFLKCCESLAFLVRDVAHITPHNFSPCVQSLRIFVEACFCNRIMTGADEPSKDPKSSKDKKNENALAKSALKKTPVNSGRPSSLRKVRSAPHNVRHVSSSATPGANSNAGSDYDADESDNEDFSSELHHVALQLLDLMHTLHTRAGQIHEDEQGNIAANTSKLWSNAWCPLLQGMARLCCDRRSHIRTSALTSLQRALLFHDLQTLSSVEWEAAFTHVLFPMLDQLLVPSQPGETTAMEETRTRGATLLGKVFLQHLTPLTTLSSFTSLWLTILEFMERFIKAASSDLLADAVPESLKNMLLVMDTAGIFYEPSAAGEDEKSRQTTLIWNLTWEKLEGFLPQLMPDLFGNRNRGAKVQEVVKANQDKVETEAQADIPNQAEVPVAENEQKPLTEERSAEVIQEPEPEIDQKPDEEPKPDEKPPVSPAEPLPVKNSAFFAQDKLEKPKLCIPPPPKIEPMPPLPGILNFQPIQTAAPTSSAAGVPLINPRPVMAPIGNLSAYFPAPPTSTGAPPGNLLTAAFTPTIGSATNTVFVDGDSDRSVKK